jgi:hypothetical protein
MNTLIKNITSSHFTVDDPSLQSSPPTSNSSPNSYSAPSNSQTIPSSLFHENTSPSIHSLPPRNYACKSGPSLKKPKDDYFSHFSQKGKTLAELSSLTDKDSQKAFTANQIFSILEKETLEDGLVEESKRGMAKRSNR